MGKLANRDGKKGGRALPAVLLIITGLIFALAIAGFHPDDSLRFSTNPRIPPQHFLGKPGAVVSSHLLYYYGRASFLLVFFLFYASYALLRRSGVQKGSAAGADADPRKRAGQKKGPGSRPGPWEAAGTKKGKGEKKRAGPILLAFTTVVSSAGFFSLLRQSPLYEGGGVLGNLLYACAKNIKGPFVFALFFLPFFGVLFFLLKFPIAILSFMVKGLARRIRQRSLRPRGGASGGQVSGEGMGVFQRSGVDRAHYDAEGFDSKNGEGSIHASSGRPSAFPDEHGPEDCSPRAFINPGVEKAKRFLFGRRAGQAEEGKGFPLRFPGGIQSLIPSPGKKPPLIRKVVYPEGGPYPADDRLSPPASIFPGGRDIERNPVQEMRGRDAPRINPVSIPEKTPSRDAIERDSKGQYVLPIVNEKRIGIISSSMSGKPLPDSSLLKKSRFPNKKERERETQKKALELERTLRDFGIEARVIGITRGPVITRYELQPAPGVKLSRIVNLSDNIALSLSANGVRIEAPIPGRSAVGIEIPNDEREIVTFGDIINEANVQGDLPLLLGRNITGNVVVSDLTAMPHLLIAGATGSGKSVCVNSLIMSLLFLKRVEDVRFIMIDPKMVELKVYNGIPHLLTEVVTDPRNASKALRWVIREMEKRYIALDEHFVRDIKGYNQKVKEKMPYIIVIVDEFANLMAISQKDVEEAIIRLAAMSRAVGIHLIMATQRPSVDVITGLIKANFPYRIAFQVASKIDSRTILDSIGAEKLLGRGDMLFSPAGSMNIQRVQGAFITEDEVYKVVQELKKNGEPEYVEEIFADKGGEGLEYSEDDPMFDEAVEIVLKTKRASASFIQRRLKIGYNRAARLIELMEEKGIIGPQRGSKPRDIYVNGGE